MEKLNDNCVSGFTLVEKLSAQLTFNGGILIGAYGLFLNSRILGIAYLLYSYVGILALMRYTVCPRCPHIHVANDCVQLPPLLTKKIISAKRSGPLNVFEKIMFVMVLYGILVIPLYWIASNTIILILFLLVYGGFLLGLYFHLCVRCRNKVCIQNRKSF